MTDPGEFTDLEKKVDTVQDDLEKANVESPAKDKPLEPAEEERQKMGLFGKVSLSALLGGTY